LTGINAVQSKQIALAQLRLRNAPRAELGLRPGLATAIDHAIEQPVQRAAPTGIFARLRQQGSDVPMSANTNLL
jgi:hypothetical protein